MPLTSPPRQPGRRANDLSHDTRLRELIASIQKIREDDRTRIARELHDDPGQLLAAVRIDLGVLLRDGHIDARGHALLQQCDERLREAISSLRRIARDLRPRALDDGGLYRALVGLQKEFHQRSGIACELYADEEELHFTDDVFSTAIFRIVQEALNNVLYHAGATLVTMSFYRIDHEVLVTVTDNGRGIEQDDLRKPGSLGLLGMRERATALGGDMVIGKDDGNGTRIDITLPLPPEDHDGRTPDGAPPAGEPH